MWDVKVMQDLAFGDTTYFDFTETAEAAISHMDAAAVAAIAEMAGLI